MFAMLDHVSALGPFWNFHVLFIFSNWILAHCEPRFSARIKNLIQRRDAVANRLICDHGQQGFKAWAVEAVDGLKLVKTMPAPNTSNLRKLEGVLKGHTNFDHVMQFEDRLADISKLTCAIANGTTDSAQVCASLNTWKSDCERFFKISGSKEVLVLMEAVQCVAEVMYRGSLTSALTTSVKVLNVICLGEKFPSVEMVSDALKSLEKAEVVASGLGLESERNTAGRNIQLLRNWISFADAKVYKEQQFHLHCTCFRRLVGALQVNLIPDEIDAIATNTTVQSLADEVYPQLFGEWKKGDEEQNVADLLAFKSKFVTSRNLP